MNQRLQKKEATFSKGVHAKAVPQLQYPAATDPSGLSIEKKPPEKCPKPGRLARNRSGGLQSCKEELNYRVARAEL